MHNDWTAALQSGTITQNLASAYPVVHTLTVKCQVGMVTKQGISCSLPDLDLALAKEYTTMPTTRSPQSTSSECWSWRCDVCITNKGCYWCREGIQTCIVKAIEEEQP